MSTDIKFEVNRQTAPSWTVKFEFMEGVSTERNQTFLGVYPKLAVQKNNECLIYFNCFGIRYKHMDKFDISVTAGQSAPLETFFSPIGNSFGVEGYSQVFICPTSKTGTITVTDSFTSYDLTWEVNADHVVLKYADYQAFIDFEHGVIDIPNIRESNMMIDFYNLCKKQHSTDKEDQEFLEKQIKKYSKNLNLQ